MEQLTFRAWVVSDTATEQIAVAEGSSPLALTLELSLALGEKLALSVGDVERSA
jgi:hypothetical protein